MFRSLLGVLLLCGCSGKTLVIDSDTAWAGEVDRIGSLDGRGHEEIGLSGFKDEVCWSIAKTTEDGTLRVYARDDTWFGLGEEIDGEAVTTAPHGRVGGCAR